MKANFILGTKRCGKCKIEKSIGEFNKNTCNSDGLQSQCRDCVNGHRREPEIKRRRRLQRQQYLSVPGVKERLSNRSATRRQGLPQIAKGLFATAKVRSRKKGVPFSITPEYVLSLLPVPFVCPLLGLPLRRGKGRACAASPTLDRIRPELGYVEGNLMVISNLANQIKSVASTDQIVMVGRRLKKMGI